MAAMPHPRANHIRKGYRKPRCSASGCMDCSFALSVLILVAAAGFRLPRAFSSRGPSKVSGVTWPTRVMVRVEFVGFRRGRLIVYVTRTPQRPILECGYSWLKEEEVQHVCR